MGCVRVLQKENTINQGCHATDLLVPVRNSVRNQKQHTKIERHIFERHRHRDIPVMNDSKRTNIGRPWRFLKAAVLFFSRIRKETFRWRRTRWREGSNRSAERNVSLRLGHRPIAIREETACGICRIVQRIRALIWIKRSAGNSSRRPDRLSWRPPDCEIRETSRKVIDG